MCMSLIMMNTLKHTCVCISLCVYLCIVCIKLTLITLNACNLCICFIIMGQSWFCILPVLCVMGFAPCIRAVLVIMYTTGPVCYGFGALYKAVPVIMCTTGPVCYGFGALYKAVPVIMCTTGPVCYGFCALYKAVPVIMCTTGPVCYGFCALYKGSAGDYVYYRSCVLWVLRPV